ncbi:hypothetical protein Taro_040510 [Colocasia esculenta]|uniref:Uncharacterized protein n=1 Tax=Colocasia esculenta TaxID=4460 RepID=A0A843WDE7_COLES|nr:hypothetical protein [Colocasia esculenta]
MSGRSHHRMGGGGPPPPRPLHEPPVPHHPAFARPPHPALLDDMREGPFGRGGGPPPRPLHPAVIEERLAAQHQEIQGLLIDNQRLAATHVALKQELAAAQHELQRVSHAVGAIHADKDAHLREKMYEKSMKLDSDLRVAEAMRAELMQVRGDIQKLNAARQELTDQVQVLNQDLARASSDLQQAPLLKADIESMKQEVQRIGWQGLERDYCPCGSGGYSGNYVNANPAYGGNPYPVGYGMNAVSGVAEAAPQYGSAHGSWGAYDTQRTHGHSTYRVSSDSDQHTHHVKMLSGLLIYAVEELVGFLKSEPDPNQHYSDKLAERSPELFI